MRCVISMICSTQDPLTHPPTYLIYLSNRPSTHPPMRPSVCLSIYAYLSICLSLCLSTYLLSWAALAKLTLTIRGRKTMKGT